MQSALKKKLDVDYKKYRMLGACNPQFAHKALQREDNRHDASLQRHCSGTGKWKSGSFGGKSGFIHDGSEE